MSILISRNVFFGLFSTGEALRGNMTRKMFEDGEPVEEPTDFYETVLPPTFLVLQIAPNVPRNTLALLVGKIKCPRRNGGGRVILMRHPVPPEDGYSFHL